MHRRTVLAGLAATIAATAGCSGSGDADVGAEATPSATASPTAAGTAGPSPTSASSDPDPPPVSEDLPLRLLSVDAPARAAIGESVTVRYTIENPTDDPVHYVPSVSVRTDGSAWAELNRREQVELGPDDIRTFTSAAFTGEYLSTSELRVDGFGGTVAVEIVEPVVPFGASLTDQLGREMTARGLTTRDSFEYTSEGYRRFVEAGDGQEWAFLDVRVINRGDEAVESPSAEGFSLHDGDTSYRPIPTGRDDEYDPVRMPPGSGATGTVAFKVPAPTLRDDLGAAWHETVAGGEVGVVWTPE